MSTMVSFRVNSFIVRLSLANVWVNGEALQLHAVYKKAMFFRQVMQESISVLVLHTRNSRQQPTHDIFQYSFVSTYGDTCVI